MMPGNQLKAFAFSFESLDQVKDFLDHTPDIHSAQVYENDNLVHVQYPAPVVEAPVPVEAPVATV